MTARRRKSDEQNHQRLTLLATSMSYVLVILDTSIVNVALESISQGLVTDVTGLQWVVTAYLVVFASLVLSGGALGDAYGARKIYMIGLVLFTAASLISGCAPSLSVLIAGRILQGMGAAMLVPNGLSLIRHAYPTTPRARKQLHRGPVPELLPKFLGRSLEGCYLQCSIGAAFSS
jgi:DHA2 family methylenomycin A resistance protein-like MFS transporter